MHLKCDRISRDRRTGNKGGEEKNDDDDEVDDGDFADYIYRAL